MCVLRHGRRFQGSAQYAMNPRAVDVDAVTAEAALSEFPPTPGQCSCVAAPFDGNAARAADSGRWRPGRVYAFIGPADGHERDRCRLRPARRARAEGPLARAAGTNYQDSVADPPCNRGELQGRAAAHDLLARVHSGVCARSWDAARRDRGAVPRTIRGCGRAACARSDDEFRRAALLAVVAGRRRPLGALERVDAVADDCHRGRLQLRRV
jgi:hypothetical protein